MKINCSYCGTDVSGGESVKVTAILKNPYSDFHPYRTETYMYCMDCFKKFAVKEIGRRKQCRIQKTTK